MSEEQTEGISKKKRRSETPQERLQRMQGLLQAARQAAEEDRKRMLVAAGEAVLAEAKDDPAFRDSLLAILRRRMKSRTAASDIAALFDDAAVDTRRRA